MVVARLLLQDRCLKMQNSSAAVFCQSWSFHNAVRDFYKFLYPNIINNFCELIFNVRSQGSTTKTTKFLEVSGLSNFTRYENLIPQISLQIFKNRKRNQKYMKILKNNSLVIIILFIFSNKKKLLSVVQTIITIIREKSRENYAPHQIQSNSALMPCFKLQ